MTVVRHCQHLRLEVHSHVKHYNVLFRGSPEFGVCQHRNTCTVSIWSVCQQCHHLCSLRFHCYITILHFCLKSVFEVYQCCNTCNTCNTCIVSIWSVCQRCHHLPTASSQSVHHARPVDAGGLLVIIIIIVIIVITIIIIIINRMYSFQQHEEWFEDNAIQVTLFVKY